MLTGDLVRVRARGTELTPGFVDPDRPALVEQAQELVACYRQGLAEGWPRSRLSEAVDGMIGDSTRHKTIRGLAKLLEDVSEFEVTCPVPPAELRQQVFRAARAHGPLALDRGPFGRPVAEDVLAEVGAAHGLSAAQVSDALYADLREEQRITACKAKDAAWLLHRYNVALAQAVLFKAVRVKVRLEAPSVPRVRQLLRYVKLFQLIHEAWREGSTLVLALDGPSSIFHQSTRYGGQLANLLPAVLLQECPWTLTADVAWAKDGRIRTLTVEHTQGLVSHYQDRGAYASREQSWFLERFQALDAGPWSLSEDTTPIDLGGRSLVLPDFTFTDGSRQAHLEIVGFWRRDYLARRIEALKRFGPGNLILAVSRNLRAGPEELDGFDGEIIPFAQVVPAKKVLEAVERVAR